MLGPVRVRTVLRAASFGWVVVATAAVAFAQATPRSPFPPADPPQQDQPVNPWDAPAIAADGAAKPPANESPLERARRQVVVLQRAGKALGMGSVLSGDGRILTALSVLGHGNNVDARFADGTVIAVRVVQFDRGWDLALVAAVTPHSDQGLRASRVAPAKESKLTAFGPGAKALAAAPVRIKNSATLVGGDNAPLVSALVLDSKHKATELGSPVIDEKGDVVAILAQACAGAADKPCSLAPFGAPVSAIKEFLRTVPTASPSQWPSSGIRVTPHDTGTVKGVRVLAVSPRSAAAGSGLRSGADTIVAVDGTPVTTADALDGALRARAGRSLELLVFGHGRYRIVRVGPAARRPGGFRPAEPRSRWPAPRRPRTQLDPGY